MSGATNVRTVRADEIEPGAHLYSSPPDLDPWAGPEIIRVEALPQTYIGDLVRIRIATVNGGVRIYGAADLVTICDHPEFLGDCIYDPTGVT